MQKKFKRYSCSLESWEEIVINRDDFYDNKTTVYYHCDERGEDFAIIVDYSTGEILYLNPLFFERGEANEDRTGERPCWF